MNRLDPIFWGKAGQPDEGENFLLRTDRDDSAVAHVFKPRSPCAPVEASRKGGILNSLVRVCTAGAAGEDVPPVFERAGEKVHGDSAGGVNQEFVPGSKPNGAAIFIQPEAQRSGSHQFTDFLIHEIDGLGMREKLAGDFFSFHSGYIDDFDV